MALGQASARLSRPRHVTFDPLVVAATLLCVSARPAAEREGEDLRLRACAVLEGQDDLSGARACYQETAGALRDQEYRALALYRAASLAVQLGDRIAAIRQLDDLVTTSPATDAAARAFRLRRMLTNEMGGVTAELEELRAVAAKLTGGSELESRALAVEAWVAVGQLELEQRQDPGAAATALLEAQRLAKGRHGWDLATFWLARARAAAGDWQAALAALHSLTRVEEASGPGRGQHDSALYDDALYEIGVTLERAGQDGKARAAYRACLDKTPDSVLADSAAFSLARLAPSVERRAALEQFIVRYPRSRHVSAARALLEAP
jgi:tetratricopeptide (TPR) repeat protein